MKLLLKLHLVTAAALLAATSPLFAAEKLKALVIDGQNQHHNWGETSPVMIKQLRISGQFEVERLTTPPNANAVAWKAFQPDFSKYDVVVLNYWGMPWPDGYFEKLRDYVASGGGLVTVHSALAAFEKQPDFPKMVGLTWRGKETGKRVYFDAKGDLQTDAAGQGEACGHCAQQTFKVTGVKGSPMEKIINDCPAHNKDEIYHALRGPAEKIDYHGTAASPTTKKNEPMIWGMPYGKGRSFVTALGHSGAAMESEVFYQTFVRGCYWAASGKTELTLAKRAIQPSRETIEKHMDRNVKVNGQYAVVKLPITNGVTLWNPTTVARDANGVMYGANYTGKIYALIDSDGDGLEDTAREFCDVTESTASDGKTKLRMPTCMVWKDGELFVGTTQEIRAYKDTTGDGKADQTRMFFNDFPWTLHFFDWTFGLTVGPDGNFYFILCTDYLNGGAAPDPKKLRGSLLKLSPDGKVLETFATGLRFAYGLGFNEDGDLFFSDNKSGGNVSEEINFAEKGKFYGHDTRKHGALPVTQPIAKIADGYGPVGLTFNPRNNDFGGTAGDMFLACWGPDGRFDRGSLHRFRVTKQDDGNYKAEQFLVAKELAKISDVEFGITGDLYISQFGNEGRAHAPYGQPTGGYFRMIHAPWVEATLKLGPARLVQGNVENGKKIYTDRTCATCHTMDNSGDLLGPDLGAAGAMFNRDEFLKNVNEPSEAIKSDFEKHIVKKKDGTALIGRIVGRDEEFLALMQPGNLVTNIKMSEVESTEMMTESLMPPGLLAGLKDSEINDLLAYMKVREVNIATTAVVTNPDGLIPDGASAKTPQAIVDGKSETYWDTTDGQKEYRLKLTFKQPTAMSILSIEGYMHQNYAPKSFDIIADGKVIKTVTDAVYKDNILELTLPTFSATELELRIFAYYGTSPGIRELHIYP